MPPCPKLFTSLDGDYAPGTIVTLLSAATSLNPTQRPLNAYVLDASPTEEPFSIVSKTLAKFPSLLNVTHLKVDTHEFNHLPALNNSHSTYCRLLIPELVDCEDAIYIDSDFLCLKDLSTLPAMPEGYLAQAAMNHSPSTCTQAFPHRSHELKNVTGPYFNGGLIHFSPESWRNHGVKEACIDAIEQFKLQQHDQSAINMVLNKKISLLDQTWNYQRPYWSKSPLDLIPRNYHFDVHKPWNHYGAQGPFQLWYAFSQSLTLFDSASSLRPKLRLQWSEQLSRFLAPFKAWLFFHMASFNSSDRRLHHLKGAAHWSEVAMLARLQRSNRAAIRVWEDNFKNLTR